MAISGRSITVMGAGFSGLTAAYFLQKNGLQVTVREASERVGGMIHTPQMPWGLIETAANGVLCSPLFEQLCADVGCAIVPAQAHSKKRYVWRAGKPRRWPLTLGESLALAPKMARIRSQKPKAGESVQGWSTRVLGPAAFQFGVAPALQGIYAGDPARLSAELVFERLFRRDEPEKEAKRFRGTVSVTGGMEGLLQALQAYLVRVGVTFEFSNAVLPEGAAVIATSAADAAKLLGRRQPELARLISQIETVPLISVSAAFERNASDVRGFGCLFPRGEGIRALGVLFEDDIFGDRAPGTRLERWILGGALDREILALSDAQLIALLLKDRAVFAHHPSAQPQAFAISRYPAAVPHYTTALRDLLQDPAWAAARDNGVSVVGNYTGKLGLAGILNQSKAAALSVSRALTRASA